jgi:hypothetical protein
MKLETFKSPTTELFLEFDGGSVTVNPWANCEGANIMVHGKDLSLRMAGALRWEAAGDRAFYGYATESTIAPATTATVIDPADDPALVVLPLLRKWNWGRTR